MTREIIKLIAVLLVGALAATYGRSLYFDLVFLHHARLTFDAQQAKRVGETK